MAAVKILTDFDVRAGSFDGLDAQSFKAGAVADVPDTAAEVFKAHGLAEDVATPKQVNTKDEK